MVRIKDNRLYCFRHKGWFFSRKYAEHKVLPAQCPLCKRYDYKEE